MKRVNGVLVLTPLPLVACQESLHSEPTAQIKSNQEFKIECCLHKD